MRNDSLQTRAIYQGQREESAKKPSRAYILIKKRWRETSLFLLVALLVVVADQFSKLWVRSALAVGQSSPTEGILRLTRLNNSGVIFGFFAQQPFFSLLFSVVVLLLALSLYLLYVPFRQPMARVALGLIVGGGIGNLIDRLHFGYVTDFVNLHIYGSFHWPVFNLADSAVVVGAGILIYLFLSPSRLGKNA